MVKNFIQGGKNLLWSHQANILSAASVIMLAVAASRVLGLVRNRTFVHFFEPAELDTFLAAFQLPDLIFEVLVLGAMSSAFIPVFSSYLGKKKEKEAWQVAALSLNFLLLFFIIFAGLIFIFANPIYSLVTAGFTPEQVLLTARFARILLVAQLFFVISYVFSGVLESHQRFLAPAVAPIFYNLGIIVTTALFAPRLGLYAPTIGAVLGAVLHLLIQLPLATSLGFRPIFSLNLAHPGVRAIGKLALPRVLELSFFQIKRLSDLFLASLIAGGLTYFKFADSLAALPVGLFGLSIAKATLPSMSRHAGEAKMEDFKNTFASSLKEIAFLVVPASVFLAVLRIPAARLAFGAAQFDWQDTVQTGYVLSAFSLGAFAYGLGLLVSRAFWALQDTFTPVKVSMATILINVLLALLFILGLGLPTWGLALAYAIAGIIQLVVLILILSRRVGGFEGYGLGSSFLKIVLASGASGGTMFILLKILDRSAWDRKLSFLGQLGLGLPTTFDRFVLDTRYTINLILLTFLVALVGLLVYLLITYLLRVEELGVFLRSLRKISIEKLPRFVKPAAKEEPLAPPPTTGSDGAEH